MFRVLMMAAAAMLAGTITSDAIADAKSDKKTWYVYCEGNGQGVHWAVFSRNIWQSPESENYGRRIGSAAEAFIEANHSVKLSGCSGVKFFDETSAVYSRDRTVRLHRKMGDRVYFINLPVDALSR